MRKLFGTDGMRGEAGVFPLDEKSHEKIHEVVSVHGNYLRRMQTSKKQIVSNLVVRDGGRVEASIVVASPIFEKNVFIVKLSFH